MHTYWKVKLVLYAAVTLSLAATLIHVWVMPEHFNEWWGYGAFFLIVSIIQGFYSGALLLWPGRSLFLAGIAGNLAIAVLYFATRTTGIPLFGPEAGHVESVGRIDLTSTVAELALVIALAALYRRFPQTSEEGGGRFHVPYPRERISDRSW